MGPPGLFIGSRRRLRRSALTRSLALAGFVCSASPALAANEISLGGRATVPVGATADLTLLIDFSDLALGGGVVIEFDASQLAFESPAAFGFSPTFPDQPGLRLVCPDAAEPACAGFTAPGVLVAFGNVAGLTGQQVVGTLTLRSLEPGTAVLTLRDDDSVAGPFVAVSGDFDPPLLTGTSIDAFAQTVPALSAPGRLALVVALSVLARFSGIAGRGGRPTRSQACFRASQHRKE